MDEDWGEEVDDFWIEIEADIGFIKKEFQPLRKLLGK